MAYATAAQLLDRYDARVLGKYAGDAGVVVSAGALLTNARVLAALDDASAMMDAALMKAKKYSPTDLAALIANPPAGNLLVRICCDLTVGLILESRLLPEEEVGKLVPRYKEARDWIDRLAMGYEVLPIDANKNAGLPDGTVRPNTPLSDYNRMFGIWGPWPRYGI